MTWIYVGIGVVVAFVIASIVIVQMSEPMPPGTTDADVARVALDVNEFIESRDGHDIAGHVTYFVISKSPRPAHT
jgi:hypothetical protein